MSTTFLSKFTYCYYFLRLWQHTNNHYVSKMIYDSIYTYSFVMYGMCQETLLNLYVKFINQHMVDRVNSTLEKRWIFLDKNHLPKPITVAVWLALSLMGDMKLVCSGESTQLLLTLDFKSFLICVESHLSLPAISPDAWYYIVLYGTDYLAALSLPSLDVLSCYNVPLECVLATSIR